VYVCVFITAGPITKLFAGGGRRRVDDMCYDRRRAEACVDESAHHALANAGGREIWSFTISVRPPKEPRMVRTFLKVHTRPKAGVCISQRLLNQVPINNIISLRLYDLDPLIL
jgi:hypothetical protein